MYKLFFGLLLLASCEKTDNINSSENKIDDRIIEKIIGHYKDEFKEMKLEKVVSDSSISIKIIDGDSEYSESIYNAKISKMKNAYIFGDVNNDNLTDVVAIVSCEAGTGGNASWNDIFVFLLEKDKYILSSYNRSDEISGCKDGNFYPEKFENGLIVGESSCYESDDAHCCPSLNYKTTVKYVAGKLVFNSKDKLKK